MRAPSPAALAAVPASVPAAYTARFAYTANGNRKTADGELAFTGVIRGGAIKSGTKTVGYNWSDVPRGSASRTSYTALAPNRYATGTAQSWSDSGTFLTGATPIASRSFKAAGPAEAFSYDKNGSLTSDASFSYTYDWAGRRNRFRKRRFFCALPLTRRRDMMGASLLPPP